MPRLPTARQLLDRLEGETIRTVIGRPNIVLALREDSVLVGTERSPIGQPVPLAWVQRGLDQLAADGVVEVTTDALEHRSAFVAAVLLTLPEAELVEGTPPRIMLRNASSYREQVAGTVNAWWTQDPLERYWLEITDRPDIGVDLHAPQRDARGNRSSGYSLLWWVERGDLVFHYHRNQRAIVAWSRAIGTVREEPVVWLSHRGATRRRVGQARPQPGWWLDLDGPYELDQPTTLAELRAHGDAIRAVLEDLRARVDDALYFPFFFYGDRELRPMQPYLNKLPASIVASLPALAAAAEVATSTQPLVGRAAPLDDALGVDYRTVAISGLAQRDLYSVDPAVVERGLAGHANTQNRLAEMLRGAGIDPRSPRPDEPDFDLAWRHNEIVFVAEVKSTTPANEERQLRLGLGQVLRYRALLCRRYQDVRAVLVAEQQPVDQSWIELCHELDVFLVWPETFAKLT